MNTILNIGDTQIKDTSRVRWFLETQIPFSSHPLVNVKFFNDSLLDNSEDINDEYHENVISRICTSYQKTKIEQEKVSLPYQVGGAWHVIETNRIEYIKALNANDFAKVSSLLKNFFRNGGVSGIWGSIFYDEACSASDDVKLNIIGSVLRDYYFLGMTIDDFDISNLSTPLIGNPWGYIIKDVLILPTSSRQYYYADLVCNILEDVSPPIVCEIGGGYGLFGYYLLSLHDKVKYINFDLPEVLLIAQYYLMMAFPDEKFLLYGENKDTNITQDTINDYDIILMPNFMLQNVDDKIVDLVINVGGGLSEMEYHTVKEYIIQIARITKGYFFHVNSDLPMLNDGHFEVEAMEFPIPRNIFKRLYKSVPVWSGGLGRYREYLYQCKKNL